MKYKFFSPLDNSVFTEVFGTQENIENTRGFLLALLDIPENEYDRLTVVNPILGRRFRRGKSGVVDVKLATKSGKIIHIEMQVEKQADMRDRILYYGARLIGNQLRMGDDYEKLKQSISIVICNHNLLEEESSYINVYELRNEKNNSFTNKLRIVILELPKIPETKDKAVWPWLQLFKCKDVEECVMLARKYPELEKTVDCVRKMSLLEQWQDYLFHKGLEKSDRISRERYVRAEGIAEGKRDTARKMKTAGKPFDEINEFTGLSLEEIEKL
jgi:predicted transposase/invertase (TIGR01784 family)